jgi:LacI family transcriptional regulator
VVRKESPGAWEGSTGKARQARGRITQRDIAAALGLSLITVQRALNKSGYVSAEVRERIEDYVSEVGYVPYKASQVLKRNHTRKLALFSSTEPEYFWEDIRTGIEAAAEYIRLFDYKVSFCQVKEDDGEAFLAALEKALEEGAEGIGFSNKWLRAMPRAAGMLASAKTPFVTFNVDAPESGRACFIGTDDRAGGRLAADYLVKVLYFRKRPSILVITTEGAASSELETIDLNAIRLEGFLEVMRKRLPEAEIEIRTIPRKLDRSSATRALRAMLSSRRESPDGIYLVAACNPPFIATLERLGFDRSYSVLHDLDKSSLHYLETNPLMAVVCQNPILQGYDAVRSLERLLEDGSLASDRIRIVHSLVFDENKDHYSNACPTAGDWGPGQ